MQTLSANITKLGFQKQNRPIYRFLTSKQMPNTVIVYLACENILYNVKKYTYQQLKHSQYTLYMTPPNYGRGNSRNRENVNQYHEPNHGLEKKLGPGRFIYCVLPHVCTHTVF